METEQRSCSTRAIPRTKNNWAIVFLLKLAVLLPPTATPSTTSQKMGALADFEPGANYHLGEM